MTFDPLAFDMLLSGPDLGSRLRWSQAHRCPCIDPEGGSSLSCQVCGGLGYVYEEWSDEFRAGLVGLTGKQLERIAQRFGPAMAGDATLSLPASSLPYAEVNAPDRFIAPDAIDTYEWTLAANIAVKVPAFGSILAARAKSNDGLSLVSVPVPVPDEAGRISCPVATVLTVKAPRRYEVVTDLTQVRGWLPGLPRKVMLKLIDVSVRW